MTYTKQIKAGYQGKKDAMREKADKLMRSTHSCKKYAMGGVAKMRHEEATAEGMPKKLSKKPFKNT